MFSYLSELDSNIYQLTPSHFLYYQMTYPPTSPRKEPRAINSLMSLQLHIYSVSSTSGRGFSTLPYFIICFIKINLFFNPPPKIHLLVGERKRSISVLPPTLPRAPTGDQKHHRLVYGTWDDAPTNRARALPYFLISLPTDHTPSLSVHPFFPIYWVTLLCFQTHATPNPKNSSFNPASQSSDHRLLTSVWKYSLHHLLIHTSHVLL